MLLVLLVQGAASGGERFAVFTMVAFVVFVSVPRLALRKRAPPAWTRILLTALFVVFGGMLFARWTYAPGVPWWIFYGVPALATFLMPPMVFRMSMRYADLGITHSGCPRTWFCSVGTSRSGNALQDRTSSVGGIAQIAGSSFYGCLAGSTRNWRFPSMRYVAKSA